MVLHPREYESLQEILRCKGNLDPLCAPSCAECTGIHLRFRYSAPRVERMVGAPATPHWLRSLRPAAELTPASQPPFLQLEGRPSATARHKLPRPPSHEASIARDNIGTRRCSNRSVHPFGPVSCPSAKFLVDAMGGSIMKREVSFPLSF
jgi:hypothetical protein